MPKSYYLTWKKKEKTKKLSSHLSKTNKKKKITKKRYLLTIFEHKPVKETQEMSPNPKCTSGRQTTINKCAAFFAYVSQIFRKASDE